MTGVVLSLVNEAIDILHKIVEAQFRNGSAKSAFAKEWVALLGCLRAVDAILKHESAELSDINEDNELLEVKKVERRLRLWSRKPEQVNSSILATYLQLCDQKKTNRIKVEKLRECYVQRSLDHVPVKVRDRRFNQNFWLMTTMGSTNHGKVFEVDENNDVMVWHKVEPAVERFREEMAPLSVGRCG